MHSLHTGPPLGLTIIQKEHRDMGLIESQFNEIICLKHAPQNLAGSGVQ